MSMRTGSRPSMSSTSTLRTWRSTRPPVCSSSKTVGIVRTGTPRSRQAATTRARRARGAGDAALNIVARAVFAHAAELLGRAEHPQAAIDPRALLARVVVDEADRLVAQLGVAQDLAQQQAAA